MDPNSHANLEQVLQSHVDFVLEADFDAKTLKGLVTITATVVEDCSQFVLDTRDLAVSSVKLISPTEKDLTYKLNEPHKAFGSALVIDIGEQNKGTELKVSIEYNTSPGASAIQWLSPSQTAEKTHPYLFTQCQAIHARSMYPSQDSCAAKITYSARITVPTGLVALMSALRKGDEGDKNGKTTFLFEQPVSLAPYLVALAIGNLASKDIGPRSKVWCEPSIVLFFPFSNLLAIVSAALLTQKLDAAAYEFAETEKYLSTAEEILGPYEWGTYDVLVLPPSFPYGGMENPGLTFATPTLLAGDRSSANVIAHEIVHSWCGNLVTNKYWTHFWMNEGFTVFNERKIVARVHGKEQAELYSLLGVAALKGTIDLFGKENQLTQLVPNLDGIDPDDAFSRVPYEKGYNFLRFLEKQFLMEQNKFGVVVSEDFQTFFTENFPDVAVDWEKWLKTPGMPLVTHDFDDSLAKTYTALANKWLEDGGATASKDDLDGWSATQTNGLLVALMNSDKKLSAESLEKLGSLYGIASSKNSEIRFSWCVLCTQSEYEPILEDACNFLLEQGRMKFTRPLYRALHNSKFGREKAISLFNENQGIYHGICRVMVAKDLGINQ